jgi:hypothetical protein
MRSLVDKERFDRFAGNPFEAAGYQFEVERRAERVFHKERRRDAQGRLLTELDVEVQFVIGSGKHGRSYLVNRAGYLYQSPISWFTQKSVWDVSPGFKDTMHANRPVVAECLFCHCNQARSVPDSVNHYQDPVFDGFAIGCERCHGPGELHVRERAAGQGLDGPDDTIVNPRKLEPVLRDSVCEQCHLQGEATVIRRGRELYDYRPGLPLSSFFSVFVRKAAFADNQRSVNHVVQMQSSRCFRESKGRLGCVSCHEVHGTPLPGARVGYFRARCLECHQESACHMPTAERRIRIAADDCTVCHMPSFGSSTIAHTALTDHRILRDPTRATPPAPIRPEIFRESPLTYFHAGNAEVSGPELERDQGVAMVEVAPWYPEGQRMLMPAAVRLLERSVETWPADTIARHTLASALCAMKRYADGMEMYRVVLAQAPTRELTLYDAAHLANRLGKPAESVEYWRRVTVVNPTHPKYHHELGRMLADQQQWAEAIRECEAALRLSPATTEARMLLIGCLVRQGSKDRARAELQTVIGFEPSKRESLQRWFEEQVP